MAVAAAVMWDKAVVLVLAMSACGDAASVPDGGLDAGAELVPDLALPACTGTPTFAAIRTGILPGNCGGAGCHRMAPFAGGLDLTDANAYASLVNVPATTLASGLVRVKPGAPLDSFFWRKLDNQLPQNGSQGLPMPLGAENFWAPLSSQQRTLIYCWIQTGAANN